ncbi:MAG: hypothetical protein CVU81_00270 [Euryarchaeota archaeon HGW-Euryarchaeota-1]|nr:MAG: hypothetical protein CVU81_00270 [Euryarchaeota archaeon HGW-Euryarchaeota-1]
MKIIPLNKLDNSFLLTVALNVGFRIPQTYLLVCEKQDEVALDEQQLRAFYTTFASNGQQQLPYTNISLAKTYELFPVNLFCDDFEKYNVRSFRDFFVAVRSCLKEDKKILIQRTVFAEKSGIIEFKNNEIKIKARAGMYVKGQDVEEYIFNKNTQEIQSQNVFSQANMLVRDDYTHDLILIPISQEQQTQPKLTSHNKMLLQQFIIHLQQLNLKDIDVQFTIEENSIFLIQFVESQVAIPEPQTEIDLQAHLPITPLLFLSAAPIKQANYVYFKNEAITSAKWIIVKKNQVNNLLQAINVYFLRDLKVLLNCSDFDIFQLEEISDILRNLGCSIGFLVHEQDHISVEDLLNFKPDQILLNITHCSENLVRELELISSRCKIVGAKCVFLAKPQNIEVLLDLILLERPLCFEITNENDIANIYRVVQNCEQKILFKAAVKILKAK